MVVHVAGDRVLGCHHHGDAVPGRARHQRGDVYGIEAADVGKGPARKGRVTDANDIAGGAAVFEKALHRVPEISAVDGLIAKRRLESVPARYLDRRNQRPALGGAEECRSAGADTLDGRRGLELFDIDARIGVRHFGPPLPSLRLQPPQMVDCGRQPSVTAASLPPGSNRSSSSSH